MRADLHSHSSASDGTDAPAEVMRRAGAAQLDVIALTDHDTVAGSCGLAFFVDQFSVGSRGGGELSIRLQRDARANRQCAVREALLCHEVADESTASALSQLFLG